MSIILHIETATPVCSVALSENAVLLQVAGSEKENDHAAHLTTLIDQVLSAAAIPIERLQAVSVSAGPGSYTGLRIGASVAKGICHALDIPLLAVNTLLAMTAGMQTMLSGTDHLFCPMLDARRMEVYSALYDNAFRIVIPEDARVMTENIYTPYLEKQSIVFFGSGMQKCRALLEHPRAVFREDFIPSAKDMIPFSHQKFISGDFASLAYFEPNYIKSFYTPPAV